jgi:hypothetical protein
MSEVLFPEANHARENTKIGKCEGALHPSRKLQYWLNQKMIVPLDLGNGIDGRITDDFLETGEL